MPLETLNIVAMSPGQALMGPAVLASWTLNIAAVAVVAAGAVAIVYVRKRKAATAGHSTQKTFESHCHRIGLTKEESDLLLVIAKSANLKTPDSIFTMDDAFDQGVAALMDSQRVLSLSPSGKKYLAGLVKSLREKLGFRVEHADGDENKISTSRQIPDGARVYMAHRGSPDGFDATVAQNDDNELLIQTDVSINVEPGAGWLVRYSEGGSVWEFSTNVIRVADGKIHLNHSEDVRFINRRRFPRVAVDKEAMVAAFPFLRPDAQMVAPQFEEARLTEIAGPGLCIWSALELKAGERAMVVVKLDEGQVVQGIGKVRRCTADADSMFTLVLEMVALQNSDIEVLARETNRAQTNKPAGMPAGEPAAKTVAETKEEPAAKEPVGEPVAQEA